MNRIVFTGEVAIALENKLKNASISDIFVLVDSGSRRYALERLGEISIKHLIEIPQGDLNKSLEQLAFIWQQLSDYGAREKRGAFLGDGWRLHFL